MTHPLAGILGMKSINRLTLQNLGWSSRTLVQFSPTLLWTLRIQTYSFAHLLLFAYYVVGKYAILDTAILLMGSISHHCFIATIFVSSHSCTTCFKSIVTAAREILTKHPKKLQHARYIFCCHQRNPELQFYSIPKELDWGI